MTKSQESIIKPTCREKSIAEMKASGTRNKKLNEIVEFLMEKLRGPTGSVVPVLKEVRGKKIFEEMFIIDV